MKLAAAATTPGRANSCQNGTDPSAKSIQTGCVFGSSQGSDAMSEVGEAGLADAVSPATAAARATPTLFTEPSLLVERRVDLGNLLGLLGLGRRVLLAEVGGAAEVEAEAREARAVAAVGVDLLERREERLALVRLLRHLLRGTDLDRAVLLEAGRSRDELPDDHVLLE